MGDESRAGGNPIETEVDGGEDKKEYDCYGRDSSNRPGFVSNWSFDWA